MSFPTSIVSVPVRSGDELELKKHTIAYSIFYVAKCTITHNTDQINPPLSTPFNRTILDELRNEMVR